MQPRNRSESGRGDIWRPNRSNPSRANREDKILKFEEEILKRCASQQYVAITDVISDLKLRPDEVCSSQMYSHLNNINRIVEKSLYMYWFSRPIRIFIEYKEFCVENVNLYLKSEKLDEVTNFVQLGIGPLHKYSKAQLHFQLAGLADDTDSGFGYNIPSGLHNRHEISEIVNLVVSSNFNYDTIKKEFGCGINVDGHNRTWKIVNNNIKESLKDAASDFVDDLQLTLSNNLWGLIGGDPLDAFVPEFIQTISKSHSSALRIFMKEVDVHQSIFESIRHIAKTYFQFPSAQKIADGIFAKEEAWNENDISVLFTHAVGNMVTQVDNDWIFTAIITACVGLATALFRPVANNDENFEGEREGEEELQSPVHAVMVQIHAQLRLFLANELSPNMLGSLIEFFESSIMHEQLVKLRIDDDGDAVIDIDFAKWIVELKEDRTLIKKKNKILASIFLPLCTTAIVFVRWANAESFMSVVKTPVDEQQKRKQAVIRHLEENFKALDMSAMDQKQPLNLVISYIQEIEAEICNVYNVPSFEAIGIGSLMHFLTQNQLLTSKLFSEYDFLLHSGQQQRLPTVDGLNDEEQNDLNVVKQESWSEELNALLDEYEEELLLNNQAAEGIQQAEANQSLMLVSMIVGLEDKMAQRLPWFNQVRTKASLLTLSIRDAELSRRLNQVLSGSVLRLESGIESVNKKEVTKQEVEIVTSDSKWSHAAIRELYCFAKVANASTLCGHEQLVQFVSTQANTPSSVVSRIVSEVHESSKYENSPILFFIVGCENLLNNMSSFAANDAKQQETSKSNHTSLPSSALDEALITTICSLSLGSRVRDCISWDVIQSSLSVENSKSRSLVDFLIANKSKLVELSNDKKLLLCPDSDDALVLTSCSEKSGLLMDILERKFESASARIICTLLQPSELVAPTKTQLSQELAASLASFQNLHGFDELLKLMLNIVAATPPSIANLASSVYEFLFDSLLSIMADTTVEELQLYFADMVWSVGSKLRCVLLNLALNSITVDKFATFARKVKQESEENPLQWFLPQADDDLTVNLNSAANQPLRVEQDVSDTVSKIRHEGGDEKNMNKNRTLNSSENHDSTQRGYVEYLQRTQFGYDEHLRRPSHMSSDATNLRNSLGLLSGKLYSSSVHFVAELIQNADDNTYTDSIDDRVIKFVLNENALTVFNNEVGFEPANIEAICRVGGSTKKAKANNIGQKGVGFKSVFSISHRPEVHSNGFHISFDREVNMLEPVWIDDSSLWPSTQHDDGFMYNTCLRLTLDDSWQKKISMLTRSLRDVFDGNLLLFLNKLTRVIFHNERSRSILEHEKRFLTNNWVSVREKTKGMSSNEVLAKDSTIFWFIEQVKFEPELSRDEVSVASTTVAIGFPFIAAILTAPNASDGGVGGDCFGEKEIRVLQMDLRRKFLPLFAYLPTTKECFPFVVQADFLLPTNRESILENNAWNRSLLLQVPDLFVSFISELAEWLFSFSSSSWDNLALLEINMKKLQDKCPRLASVCDGFEAIALNIRWSDLLAVIPLRRDDHSRDIIEIVDMVISKLSSIAILPAVLHGDNPGADEAISYLRCAPGELYWMGKCSFDLYSLLPWQLYEKYLLPTLKRRPMLHNEEIFQMDEQLALQLGIFPFDEDEVVKAFHVLSYTTASTLLDSTQQKQVIKLLAGLLLILRQQYNDANKRLAMDNNKTGSASEHRRSWKRKLVEIRSLPIWPIIENGKFVSLQDNLIVIWNNDSPRDGPGGVEKTSSSTAGFTSRQQKCLDIIMRSEEEKLTSTAADDTPQKANALFHQLSPLLLLFADEVFVQGGSLLQSFLLDCFSSGNSHCGIDVLTADVIAERIIMPALLEKQTSKDSIDEALSQTYSEYFRLKVSAMIGFIFLSKPNSTVVLSSNKPSTISDSIFSRIKQMKLALPTVQLVQVTDHSKSKPELQIVPSELSSVSNNGQAMTIEAETHFGVEIESSAVNVFLASANFSPDMLSRTMSIISHWKFVDPLLSAIAFGCNQLIIDTIQAKASLQIDYVRRLCKAPGADIKGWKEFLSAFGVIDFFGCNAMTAAPSRMMLSTASAAAAASSEEEVCTESQQVGMQIAPTLFQMLSILLEDAELVENSKVCSTTQLTSNPMIARMTDSGATPSFAVASRDYFPLLLLHDTVENCKVEAAVYRVSQPTHLLLWCVSKLLMRELSLLLMSKVGNVKNSAQQLKQLLDNLSWFPIDQTVFFVSTSGGKCKKRNEYLITAPCNVFADSDGNPANTLIVGPHFPYLPNTSSYVEAIGGPRSYQELSKFWSFVLVNPSTHPTPAICVSLICWMNDQNGEKIASSIAFLKYLYKLLNSKHLSTFFESNAVAASKLKSLLSSETSSILWFPDDSEEENMSDDRNCDEKPYCSGQTYPFSSMVRRDGSILFGDNLDLIGDDLSPVKVISKYYASVKDIVLDTFVASAVCSDCINQHGSALGNAGFCLSSTTGRECKCAGATLFKMFGLPGLIPIYPSARALLCLYTHFRSQLLDSTSVHSDNDRQELIENVKSVLQVLSCGVWSSLVNQYSKSSKKDSNNAVLNSSSSSSAYDLIFGNVELESIKTEFMHGNGFLKAAIAEAVVTVPHHKRRKNQVNKTDNNPFIDLVKISHGERRVLAIDDLSLWTAMINGKPSLFKDSFLLLDVEVAFEHGKDDSHNNDAYFNKADEALQQHCNKLDASSLRYFTVSGVKNSSLDENAENLDVEFPIELLRGVAPSNLLPLTRFTNVACNSDFISSEQWQWESELSHSMVLREQSASARALFNRLLRVAYATIRKQVNEFTMNASHQQTGSSRKQRDLSGQTIANIRSSIDRNLLKGFANSSRFADMLKNLEILIVSSLRRDVTITIPSAAASSQKEEKEEGQELVCSYEGVTAIEEWLKLPSNLIALLPKHCTVITSSTCVKPPETQLVISLSKEELLEQSKNRHLLLLPIIRATCVVFLSRVLLLELCQHLPGACVSSSTATQVDLKQFLSRIMGELKINLQRYSNLSSDDSVEESLTADRLAAYAVEVSNLVQQQHDVDPVDEGNKTTVVASPWCLAPVVVDENSIEDIDHIVSNSDVDENDDDEKSSVSGSKEEIHDAELEARIAKLRAEHEQLKLKLGETSKLKFEAKRVKQLQQLEAQQKQDAEQKMLAAKENDNREDRKGDDEEDAEDEIVFVADGRSYIGSGSGGGAGTIVGGFLNYSGHDLIREASDFRGDRRSANEDLPGDLSADHVPYDNNIRSSQQAYKNDLLMMHEDSPSYIDDQKEGSGANNYQPTASLRRLDHGALFSGRLSFTSGPPSSRPLVEIKAATSQLSPSNLRNDNYSSLQFDEVIKNLSQQATKGSTQVLDVTDLLSVNDDDLASRIEQDASNGVLSKPSTTSVFNESDIGVIAAKYKVGRIGEQHAVRFFQSIQAAVGIEAVHWINEQGESTRPYDIVLSLKNADQQQQRGVEEFEDNNLYVEVKAKVNADNDQQHAKTWFISENELFEARRLGRKYSLVLIQLAKDNILHVESMQVVGLSLFNSEAEGEGMQQEEDGGLFSALQSQQVKLLLQVT